MKKDIRVIVSDIDGTLIPNNPHYLTDYGREILTRLHNEGVLIGLASGRNVQQIKNFEDEFNLPFHFDIIIGQNGEELFDLANDSYEQLGLVAKSDVKYIIEKMLEKYPFLNPYCYDDGDRLCYRDEFIAKTGNHNFDLKNREAKSLDEFWSKDRYKIMLRVSEEVMSEILPYAKSIENGNFYAIRTQATVLEFMNVNATKGKALEKYMQNNHLDKKYVMTFGDFDNDNDMLEASGFGVALKNADSSTIAIADDVTELTNVDDGMHHYIEEKLLN